GSPERLYVELTIADAAVWAFPPNIDGILGAGDITLFVITYYLIHSIPYTFGHEDRSDENLTPLSCGKIIVDARLEGFADLARLLDKRR
ncbi:MAG: hypothetical protein ACRECN_05960, partial [Methylocella sp.]